MLVLEWLDGVPSRDARPRIQAITIDGSSLARELLYLAILNAVPAWTRTRNWTTALLAFKIHFGDRLPD